MTIKKLTKSLLWLSFVFLACTPKEEARTEAKPVLTIVPSQPAAAQPVAAQPVVPPLEAKKYCVPASGTGPSVLCSDPAASTAVAPAIQSNSPPSSAPKNSGNGLSFESATCDQLFANPGIGADQQYCIKCFNAGEIHRNWCLDHGLTGKMPSTDGTNTIPRLADQYNPSAATLKAPSEIVNCLFMKFDGVKETRGFTCGERASSSDPYPLEKFTDCQGGFSICNCSRYYSTSAKMTRAQCDSLAGKPI